MEIPYMSYKVSVLIEEVLNLAKMIEALPDPPSELIDKVELHLQALTELAGFLKETINREYSDDKSNKFKDIKTPDGDTKICN